MLSLVWIPAFAGMTERRTLNVPNSSGNAIYMQSKSYYIILHGINAVKHSVSSFSIKIITHPTVQNFVQTTVFTATTRVFDNLSHVPLLSERAKKAVDILSHGTLLSCFAYDFAATLISLGVSLSTQFLMTKLGFKPSPATRQVAAITAITSFYAYRLYQNPSPNNVQNLLTTVVGTSVGVIGTDWVLDKSEKVLTQSYNNFCKKGFFRWSESQSEAQSEFQSGPQRNSQNVTLTLSL